MAADTKTFDIVVVGELSAALYLRGNLARAFEHVAAPLDQAALSPGSAPAVFACAAARLGLRVAIIGRLGDDAFGRFLLRELAASGVDTTGIHVDTGIRTGLRVTLAQEHERAALAYPGTSADLRFEEIPPDIIGQARHLHLGGYFALEPLQPDIPRLFETARRQGVSISLDPNPDPQWRWENGVNEALKRVDIFLPNESELCGISGLPDVHDALVSMAGQVPTVAVKQGARGALARQGEVSARSGTMPVRVVDTSGAGDAFDAGFLYGLLDGWELERALRLGCVCGTLATRSAGATVALPTLAEALATM